MRCLLLLFIELFQLYLNAYSTSHVLGIIMRVRCIFMKLSQTPHLPLKISSGNYLMQGRGGGRFLYLQGFPSMRKKLIPSTFHRVMQSRATNKIRKDSVQQLYSWLGGVEVLLNHLNRTQKGVDVCMYLRII